jgi:hypothetical protein
MFLINLKNGGGCSCEPYVLPIYYIFHSCNKNGNQRSKAVAIIAFYLFIYVYFIVSSMSLYLCLSHYQWLRQNRNIHLFFAAYQN